MSINNGIRILITGGSRGIGQAIVKELKREGYEVYAPTREDLDLKDINSVNSFCNKNVNEKFDILINNAGINPISNVENINNELLIDVMNVNLLSPILLTKMVVKGMKHRNFGRVINIGSIWNSVGKAGRSTYAATKSGLVGFTKHLAVEVAEFNILVNTISPGYVNTELTKQNNTDESIRKISNTIPLKRLAEPVEIAHLVSFLIGKNNKYITGQEIVIDGGFTINSI